MVLRAEVGELGEPEVVLSFAFEVGDQFVGREKLQQVESMLVLESELGAPLV